MKGLSMPISVDIVVPTYNRAAELAATLKSLACISVPDNACVRVIVVDNNSVDETQSVIAAAMADAKCEIVSVVEKEQGLSAARNAGISASSADIIVFIDDDVNLHRGWLEAIVRAFLETECAVVGGKAELLFPVPKPEWLGPAEETDLSRVDLGEHRCECEPEQVFGLNMSLRRDWITRVGNFRVDLGRVGTCLMSGDESDLIQRIQDAGGLVVYDPDALLWHRVAESRLSREWFLNRFYWGQRSGIRLKRTSKDGLVRDLLSGVVQFCRAGASLAWRSAKYGSNSEQAYKSSRWLMCGKAELHEAIYALRTRG